MDPSDIAFIKGVIVFVLCAGAGLGALRMWLRARYSDQRRLEPVLQAMQEENAELRSNFEARVAELEERLDFAERRLVQERGLKPLPGETARTPV